MTSKIFYSLRTNAIKCDAFDFTFCYSICGISFNRDLSCLVLKFIDAILPAPMLLIVRYFRNLYVMISASSQNLKYLCNITKIKDIFKRKQPKVMLITR